MMRQEAIETFCNIFLLIEIFVKYLAEIIIPLYVHGGLSDEARLNR